MRTLEKIVYLENMVRFVCASDSAQRRACVAELAALRSEANEHRPYYELNAVVRGRS